MDKIKKFRFFGIQSTTLWRKLVEKLKMAESTYITLFYIWYRKVDVKSFHQKGKDIPWSPLNECKSKPLML